MCLSNGECHSLTNDGIMQMLYWIIFMSFDTNKAIGDHKKKVSFFNLFGFEWAEKSTQVIEECWLDQCDCMWHVDCSGGFFYLSLFSTLSQTWIGLNRFNSRFKHGNCYIENLSSSERVQNIVKFSAAQTMWINIETLADAHYQ